MIFFVDLKKLWKQYGKLVLISTFVVFFIVYWYFLVSEPMNSDWLTTGFLKHQGAYENDSIGRWGRRYAEMLIMKAMNPGLSFFVAASSLTLMAILLIDLYEIKSRWFRAMLGPILAVSPCIIDMMQWIADVLFYTSCICIMVLAGYIISRYDSLSSSCIVVMLLLTSLSIYQGYVGVFLAVVISHLLLSLLRSEENLLAYAIKFTIRCAICSASACIMYFVIWKTNSYIRHSAVSVYAGIDQIGNTRPISEYVKAFIRSYTLYIDYFKTDVLHIGWFWSVLFIISLVCILCRIFYLIRHGNLVSPLLVLILLSVLPLFSNVTCLLAIGYGMEGRTSMQCQLLFAFVIGLLSIYTVPPTISRALHIACIICSCTLIMAYGVRAYSSVRTWDIGTRAMKYQVERALTHALEDPQYKPDMPIVFIGFPSDSVAQELNPLHEYSYNDPYVFWKYKDEVLLGQWRQFVGYYFGVDIGWISDVDYQKVINSDAFSQMREYPSPDAYKVIDGYYIILLDIDSADLKPE